MPSETVFVASLFDANGGAMMFVTRSPLADATEDPLETGERVAEYVERDSDTLGRADFSLVNLPVGQSYFVAWKSSALEGEVTDTRFVLYGMNHEGHGYQLSFAIPATEGPYESDADDIARSFSWTAHAA